MTIQRRFQLAAHDARYVRNIPGLLGRKDGPSTWTFTVPGGQGYTYVRVGDSSGSVLTVAFNRAGVASTGDLKIWLQIGADGRLVISGERY